MTGGIDPAYVTNLENQVISLQMGLDAYQDFLGMVKQYLDGIKVWDKSSGEVFQLNKAPLKLEGDLNRFEILKDNVIPYEF